MRLPHGHRWFPTIRSRLLAALVGCVLLPLLAGQLWMQLGTRASLIDSELEKYQSLTSQAARQVAAHMRFYEGNLQTLSKNALLQGKDTVDQLDAAISNIYEAGTFWTDISLYDDRGDLVTSTAKVYAEPKELTDWFARALKGEVVIAPPQRVMRHEGLDVAVYIPVTEKTSKKKLVVRGLVSFEEVRESIKARLELEATQAGAQIQVALANLQRAVGGR